MAVSPAQLRPKNDCAEKDRQQFKLQTHPLVREGAPHQQTTVWQYKNPGHGPQMGAWTKTD
jgi:hypothetical protein